MHGCCTIITCMINTRLFEHYKINTGKDLKIKNRCPRPFDTLLVDKEGSCFACECTAWLPQSIGNLHLRDLTEILQSPVLTELQASIDDGSYRYCNAKQCAYLNTREFADTTTVFHLRLAIDDSCNLRCPSCRKDLVFHKSGTKFNARIRLADRINHWLDNTSERPIQVHIGSDGDPFASHVYRHFMEGVPDKDNIRYSMLTNGLLFKDFSDKVPQVLNKLDKLSISIDGATQDTYEKLRLGGSWKKISEALLYISEIKKKYNFEWSMHMVVQKDNWWEMSTMLELAHKLGVDKVYYNKIQDWNTGIDMSLQDLDNIKGVKEECEKVRADPIARVWLL